MTLLERFLAGDERALARVLSLVEAGTPAGETLLAALRALGRRSVVVGLTGAPGSGKSTLADRLVAEARGRGERVAVLAVDPSSPFSGGAILGDRVRMGRHWADKGVFVRSMASRGRLGGLARATVAAVSVLEAHGFARVFLETVGVGQSEVDIASVADHTVLVLTPAGGDAVQAFKAGVMEIADVFAVNKADLPGADRMVREIGAALELGAHDENTWWPPVIKTVAATGEGAADLLAACDAHRDHLGAAGLERRRVQRARFEVGAAVSDEVRRLVEEAGEPLFEAVASGSSTAEAAVRRVLEVAGR